MPADGQDIEQWKQKYYDQLDILEKKEHDWESLESILKRTISRLSLAAEGQHKTLDRHLLDLRSSIKNQIKPDKLETIVDSISTILTQLEEKQTQPDSQYIDILHQLVSQLDWPKPCHKAAKKLQQVLDRSNDDNRQQLVTDTVNLIKQALSISSSQNEPEKEQGGLLGRLFQSDSKDTQTKDIATDPEAAKLLGSILKQLFRQIPWPQSIEKSITDIISNIDTCEDIDQLNNSLHQLASNIEPWPADISDNPAASAEFSSYRHCLLDLIKHIDNPDSASGKLSALQLSIKDTDNQLELEKLNHQLSTLLTLRDNAQPSVTSNNLADSTDINEQSSAQTLVAENNIAGTQPGIQELLIRLLEQLIVPDELQPQAEQMKHRLEQDTHPDNWKALLKDVASLINSIRSYLQKEKYEFETFLHQVTDRLKAMDQFLQTETESLQAAETQGNQFDLQIHTNVDEIRQDVDQAADLNNLKQTVSTKLDTISTHIKDYRDSEKQRLHTSQQQLDSMHNRMQELENETQTLKKVVVEKNKQAMFDALTGIPNRLSYEKKIEEEVARWKRFSTPLSLAVWDIDFFKKVNDTYGHKAGDKVLKTVAQLLNKRIRKTDFLARYGGEEFVMLLPGTKQEETLRLVNNLRSEVENCGFHYHGDAVKITVSCGVSCFNSGDTVNNVFERADKALYKAKHNGRNQCVIASSLSD